MRNIAAADWISVGLLYLNFTLRVARPGLLAPGALVACRLLPLQLKLLKAALLLFLV
jgi:hypothetical protein